jgi:hypothetical protein
MESLLCTEAVQKVLYDHVNGGLRDGYVFFYNPHEMVPSVQLHHLPRRRMTLVLPPHRAEFASYENNLRLLLGRSVSGTGTDWDGRREFREYIEDPAGKESGWSKIKQNARIPDLPAHPFLRGLDFLCAKSNLRRSSVPRGGEVSREEFCRSVDIVCEKAIHEGNATASPQTKDGYLHQLTARRLLDEYVIQRRQLLRSVQVARHGDNDRGLEDIPFIREVQFDYYRCPRPGQSNRVLLVEEGELFLGNCLQRCADLYWQPVFAQRSTGPTEGDPKTKALKFQGWQRRTSCSATWLDIKAGNCRDSDSVLSFLRKLQLIEPDTQSQKLTNCALRMVQWLSGLISARTTGDPRQALRDTLFCGDPPPAFQAASRGSPSLSDQMPYYGLGLDLDNPASERELADLCEALQYPPADGGVQPCELLARLLCRLLSAREEPYTDDDLALIFRVDPIVMQIQLACYEEAVNAGHHQGSIRIFCSLPIDPVNFFGWKKRHPGDGPIRPDKGGREHEPCRAEAEEAGKEDAPFGIWVGFIEQPRSLAPVKSPKVPFHYDLLYSADHELRYEAEREFRERVHRLRIILNTIFQPVVREYVESKLRAAKKDAEKNARQATDSAIHSAVAAIMARNMSHNLGSHVLAHFERHHASVWDEISKRVGLDAPGQIDASLTEMELRREQFVRYLQARMDFVAYVVTTVPTYADGASLRELLDEFNSCSFVTSGLVCSEHPFHRFRIEAVSCAGFYEDFLAWPMGYLGRQAFFALVEGIARNSVKHSRLKQEELVLHVMCKEVGQHFVEVRIWDDLKSYDKAHEKLSAALRDPFLEGAGTRGDMGARYWGIKEMRICAAFLLKFGALHANANSMPDDRQGPKTASRYEQLLAIESENGSVAYRFLVRKFKYMLLLRSGSNREGKYCDAVSPEFLDETAAIDYLMCVYDPSSVDQGAVQRHLPIRRIPLDSDALPDPADGIDRVLRLTRDYYAKWVRELGGPKTLVFAPDVSKTQECTDVWRGIEGMTIAQHVDLMEYASKDAYLISEHLLRNGKITVEKGVWEKFYGVQDVSMDTQSLRSCVRSPTPFSQKVQREPHSTPVFECQLLRSELFTLGIREAAATRVLIADERLFLHCQDKGPDFFDYLSKGQKIWVLGEYSNTESFDESSLLFTLMKGRRKPYLKKPWVDFRLSSPEGRLEAVPLDAAFDSVEDGRKIAHFACIHLGILEKIAERFGEKEARLAEIVQSLEQCVKDGFFDCVVVHSGRGRDVSWTPHGASKAGGGVRRMSLAALESGFHQGKVFLCRTLYALRS